jgi:uncharacterized membrane protein
MKSKFQSDIKELVSEQVISKDVATKIEAYCLSKQSDSPNRLLTVFGVLGSALVGMGIILILAHNWDNFTKTIKTFFAFLPLIIGQLIVGYVILKERSETWKESSGVFLFFAVGASMALISQIYNIPDNLSAYLLTWVLLCSPLIYLLKSNMLAVLHVLFATSYACSYGYFLGNQTPWLYLLLLAIVVPRYMNLLKKKEAQNMSSVLNWLIPLSLIISFGAFVKNNEQFGYLIYIILFGLLFNIGKTSFFYHQKFRRNGYYVLGSLGTIFMLLLVSFKWLWENIFTKAISFNSQEFYIVLFLCVVSIILLSYSYSKKWFTRFDPFQIVFLIFTLVFFIGLASSIVPIIIINALLLFLGVFSVKEGISHLSFGTLNYGLLIISALILCRFFDTNMSFVIRGLLFVSVGLGFFFTNYIIIKRQKIGNKK